MLPIDIENLSHHIYNIYMCVCSYISSSCIIFSRSVLWNIVIHRVGDNGRTVNTSTRPHISGQLGTENACLTLLCWFIVMIWVLVCKNMYRCERYLTHFESFYHNPISSDGFGCRLLVNGFSTRTLLKILFYWKTTTGNNSSIGVPLWR